MPVMTWSEQLDTRAGIILRHEVPQCWTHRLPEGDEVTEIFGKMQAKVGKHYAATLILRAIHDSDRMRRGGPLFCQHAPTTFETLTEAARD